MFEGDHINFERHAGDFLGLDPDDRTHAVGWIDDVIANGEIVDALVHENVLFSLSRRYRRHRPNLTTGE
jgi:hypothetical protein